MGYRMEYGTGNQDAVFRKIGNGKKKHGAIVVILAALLLGCYLHRTKIADYLLPGDPGATRKAIRVFVSELKEGERATDAFEAFCKVIINEANLS